MIEELKKIRDAIKNPLSVEKQAFIQINRLIEELEAKEPLKHHNCIVNILTPGEPPKAHSLTDVVVHMDDTGYFAISGVKAK